MSRQPISYIVDPKKLLAKKYAKLIDEVDDLRIPLQLIKESWFRGNSSIFALSGPGRWADLSGNYKKRKEKDLGFVYPILFRTGKLKSALTVEGDPNSVTRFPNTKTLEIGVDPDNVVFQTLNNGSLKKNIPARQYILLGVEQVAPSALNKRVQIWTKILQDYVVKKSGDTLGKV